MINRYRLTSTVYDREDEKQKILPEKRIFLSVEGNATEKEYFDGVSKNREKIGIPIVHRSRSLNSWKSISGFVNRMRMIF